MFSSSVPPLLVGQPFGEDGIEQSLLGSGGEAGTAESLKLVKNIFCDKEL